MNRPHFHVNAHLLGSPSTSDLRQIVPTRFEGLMRARLLAHEALLPGGRVEYQMMRYSDPEGGSLDVDVYDTRSGAGRLVQTVAVVPCDLVACQPDDQQPGASPEPVPVVPRTQATTKYGGEPGICGASWHHPGTGDATFWCHEATGHDGPHHAEATEFHPGRPGHKNTFVAWGLANGYRQEGEVA